MASISWVKQYANSVWNEQDFGEVVPFFLGKNSFEHNNTW